jgi:hypothetical protein
MRKTLATLAALSAALVVLSACGNDTHPSGAPASASASPAVSEPTADTSGEVPTDGGAVGPADITGLKVTRAGGTYPKDTVMAEYVVKNSSTYACTFSVVIGIFDSTGAQVAAVHTDSTEFGPTVPGGTAHVSGPWDVPDGLPAGAFTASITEAQRVPA